MCGIAGIIHRDGAARIGDELTAMLNSMKHRGPDSTGYAIYGPADEMVIVRFVLAEPNEPSDDLATKLQDHVKNVTAPYKYPREVEFVADLPKTISGKIRRNELRRRDL